MARCRAGWAASCATESNWRTGQRTSTISPLVDKVPGKTLVRVTLHEGRKRIVRRLLAAVGYPVQELVRTDIGSVTLGDQRPGSIRVLSRKEIGELYKAVGL